MIKKVSALEETFVLHCKAHRLDVVREHRFHPVRRWRFDFAIPARMIAIEAEGMIWANGRHNRGSGFTQDCEKYNEAAKLGWFVFRFTGNQIKSGQAIKFILEVLNASDN